MRIDLAGLSDTDRAAVLNALADLDPPVKHLPSSPRLAYSLPFFDLIVAPWREDAACMGSDPDLFFPEQGGSAAKAREAKRICFRCPVRQDCLDYALVTGSRFGIWGGMTEKERRNVRRRQRRAM